MRIPGWEKRLVEFIQEAMTRRFEYGTFDCCLFACDAIRMLTDKNPREIVAENYHDENGAGEMILKYGGVEGIASAVAGRFGFPSIPVLFAQRGDIVLAEFQNEGRDIQVLGVCTGRQVVFPKKEKGLARVNIDSKLLIRAWRI